MEFPSRLSRLPDGRTPRWPGRLLTALLALAVQLLASPALSAATVLLIAHEHNPAHARLIKQITRSLDSDTSGSVVVKVVPEGLAPEKLRSAIDLAAPSLVVTAGTEAAVEISNLPGPLPPVLYTLIPRLSYRHIVHTAEPRAEFGRRSAVFLDQPFERRLRLLALALPESRRLTVPLGKWSRVLKPEIEKAAGERWHLDLVDVNGEQALVPTLEKHLRSSDVLFAVADPTVFNRNTVQGILLTTYHFGVPVLGFSRNYVRAGALLAVFSTPEQMGRHIGDYIAALARNKQWELSAPEYPRYFSVAVNRQVARSLGLTIDSDDALLHRLEASE